MTPDHPFPGAVPVTGGLAIPTLADRAVVSRCDRLAYGVTLPGLLMVARDGRRTFYPVGVNGPTETIVFHWVGAHRLFPDGTVYGDCQAFLCGVSCPYDGKSKFCLGEARRAEPEPEPQWEPVG
jgi:hypothetical protein